MSLIVSLFRAVNQEPHTPNHAMWTQHKTCTLTLRSISLCMGFSSNGFSSWSWIPIKYFYVHSTNVYYGFGCNPKPYARIYKYHIEFIDLPNIRFQCVTEYIRKTNNKHCPFRAKQLNIRLQYFNMSTYLLV